MAHQFIEVTDLDTLQESDIYVRVYSDGTAAICATTDITTPVIPSVEEALEQAARAKSRPFTGVTGAYVFLEDGAEWDDKWGKLEQHQN